jgi:hypothetical protein
MYFSMGLIHLDQTLFCCYSEVPMSTQVMLCVLWEVLCLMRQTRVLSYSIDTTWTYVVVMEQWSNFTLHFGCIGVHKHIEKVKSDF